MNVFQKIIERLKSSMGEKQLDESNYFNYRLAMNDAITIIKEVEKESECILKENELLRKEIKLLNDIKE